MIDIEDRIKQKKFDEISEFNDNKYALARIEDKVGVIDFCGNVIIPFEYEAEVYEFFDPETEKYENNGYILRDFGKISNDLYVFRKNGKEGVVNIKNEIIIPFEFECINLDYTELENQQLFIASKKIGYWGIINRQGETVVDFKYDPLYREYFSNKKDYYFHAMGEQTNIFDKNGKQII